MRVALPGVERETAGFSFSFDGAAITAFPGESIASALIAAGQLTCRETAAGEPRGVYCGMGVCGECSVLVEGRSRRACMEKALPHMHVQRHPARRALPETPSKAAPRSWRERETDVLVIGAGPAGLSAATAAAAAGASVLVVDERAQAGGQYFKQPGAGFRVAASRLDAQFREGRSLIDRALTAGVEFAFETTVWGAFPGPEVAAAASDGNQLIRARRVVLSPGAYERARPFPGWTLPGVMTTGAAQTLLRAYQTAPGKRILVAGNGPLNLQVARELQAVGATVVAVAELAAAPGLAKLGPVMRMARHAPGLLCAGLGHTLHLARNRVPVQYRHAVFHAEGHERVSAVTIAAVDADGAAIEGTEKRFEVDAVCLGYGFLPQSELARALGIGPEVVVLGDAAGLGGALVAVAQGALVGASLAADLGLDTVPAPRRQRQLRKSRAALGRHRRFQRALWSFYSAPEAPLAAADDATVVCRCESVTLGRLRALRDQGVATLGGLKRETRAGMGRCQGRYCTGFLRAVLELPTSAANADEGQFAPRPPFKSLTVSELAAGFDDAAVFDRTAGMSRGEASADGTVALE